MVLDAWLLPFWHKWQNCIKRIGRDLASFRHCGNPKHPRHFPWCLRQQWSISVYWANHRDSSFRDNRLSRRIVHRPPPTRKQLLTILSLQLIADTWFLFRCACWTTGTVFNGCDGNTLCHPRWNPLSLLALVPILIAPPITTRLFGVPFLLPSFGQPLILPSKN